jgi:spore coat protein E
MSLYREIVTKAVIGKGRLKDNVTLILPCEHKVTKTLGCWIINNEFTPVYEKGKTYIKGKCELHIWYAYSKDTKTALFQTIHEYQNEVDLRMKNEENVSDTSELKAFCIKYPTCTRLIVAEGGKIGVDIEKEYSIDVIGETKLKVQVSKLAEDEWLLDEEIDNNVNVEYLDAK